MAKIRVDNDETQARLQRRAEKRPEFLARRLERRKAIREQRALLGIPRPKSRPGSQDRRDAKNHDVATQELSVAVAHGNVSSIHNRVIPGLIPGSVRTNFSSEVTNKVFSRDCGKCLACGSKTNLCIDHIVPISRGGSNDFNNLQLLCSDCNASKGTAPIDFRR